MFDLEVHDPKTGNVYGITLLGLLPMGGGSYPGEAPAVAPVLMGGLASSVTPDPTADGTVVNPLFDAYGRLHTINDGRSDPAQDGVSLGANAASPGALLPYQNDALLAAAVAVKAGAGRLHTIHVHNPSNAAAYLHFYDLAQGSVTVGASDRKWSLGIAAGGVISLALPAPVGFGTAITIAASTTATGSTAPSAGLVVALGYI